MDTVGSAQPVAADVPVWIVVSIEFSIDDDRTIRETAVPRPPRAVPSARRGAMRSSHRRSHPGGGGRGGAAHRRRLHCDPVLRPPAEHGSTVPGHGDTPGSTVTVADGITAVLPARPGGAPALRPRHPALPGTRQGRRTHRRWRNRCGQPGGHSIRLVGVEPVFDSPPAPVVVLGVGVLVLQPTSEVLGIGGSYPPPGTSMNPVAGMTLEPVTATSTRYQLR